MLAEGDGSTKPPFLLRTITDLRSRYTHQSHLNPYGGYLRISVKYDVPSTDPRITHLRHSEQPFDRFYASHPMGFGKRPSKSIVDFIKQIGPTTSGDALDLGCGTGRNTFFLARSRYRVHAVDASSEAISKLIASAKEQQLECQIVPIRADARRIKLPIKEFDLALAYTLIDHIDRPSANLVINNIFHSLKPGGYFLVTVYSKDDPGFFAGRNTINSPTSFWIKNPYSRDDLLSAFSHFHVLSYREIRFEDRNHGLPHWHVMHQIIVQRPKSS